MTRPLVARLFAPVWLLVVLLVAGCGGNDNDSSAPKSPFETFSEQIADTICSSYLACNCLQEAGLADCKSQMREMVIRSGGYIVTMYPGAQFNKTKADTCLAQYQAAPNNCTTEMQQIVGCEDAELMFFEGMQGDGEPCTITFECAEGFGCNVLVAACAPLATVGQDCTYLDCAEGFWCDSGAVPAECVALLAATEICYEDSQCQAGHICYDAPGLPDSGVCEPPHATDEACVEDQDCSEGAFCLGTTEKCTATLANGEDCSDDSQCASDTCDDGKCLPTTFCGSIMFGPH